MKRGIIVLSIATGLGLVLALTWVAGRAQASYLELVADPNAAETNLNALGAAFELNKDDQGHLWVTDLDASEIWQINVGGGTYTIYEVGGAPADARRDPWGNLWWADSDRDALGKLAPGSSDASFITLPGSTTPLGTAVDGSGRVWVTDFFQSNLFRYDPAQTELCTYSLPNDGTSNYVVASEENVLLGDWKNDRFLQLDSDAGEYSFWQLPNDVYMEGLAVDYKGHYWWADTFSGTVARLDPVADSLTTFSLPADSSPEMLSPAGNNIWYSEDWFGTLALLDPDVAPGIVTTPTHNTVSASSACAPAAVPTTVTIAIATNSLSWTTSTYITDTNAAGLLQYQLPSSGSPWGITAMPTGTYVADYGRQKLVEIAPLPVNITACKLEDPDRNLETTGDRSPIQDWTIYLTIDGIRQIPGQLTDAEGCVNWNDLDPGPIYGVEEEVPEGWTAVTPSKYSFGPGITGANYDFTFINVRTDFSVYLPMIIK